jgi:hypothetical protein
LPLSDGKHDTPDAMTENVPVTAGREKMSGTEIQNIKKDKTPPLF